MTKQIIHKVLIIVVFLVVFSIPFYIERSQTSHIDNAYMIGAVINNSKLSTYQTPQNKLTNIQVSVWANVIGNTFIGSRVE